MGNTKSSIGTNAILNGLKAVLSVIFPLITYPYALRVLQVENVGKVDFSNSIVNYFVLLGGLGIATYATREGASIRGDKYKLEKFSCEIFSINTISTLFAFFALVVISVSLPSLETYIPLILIQSIIIIGNLFGVIWLYQVMEDYYYITIRSLVIHIVALVLLFVFVRRQTDYIWYAATTVIANTGANFFNFYHSRKYLRIRFTLKLNLRKHIKPIMVIFASSIASTIYVNSDKTLLGLINGDYYVGLYSSAVNVYTVLKICVMSVILVALPRLTNYLAEKRTDDYYKDAEYILRLSTFFLFPIIAGVVVASKEIILLVGGASYYEAIGTLQILAISLLFAIFATYYTNVVLLPHGKETTVFVATIISAIVNIVLNIVLLKTYKHNGAAVTTLISEFVMFMAQYIPSKKIFSINFPKKHMITIAIGCIAIFLNAFLVDHLVCGFTLHLVLKIALCIVAYLAVVVILKNDILFDLLHKVSRLKEN